MKDQFASERRKAKTLNFSIAYGKTARGLSKDWGVTLAEAEETLERWFADRPEGEEICLFCLSCLMCFKFALGKLAQLSKLAKADAPQL